MVLSQIKQAVIVWVDAYDPPSFSMPFYALPQSDYSWFHQ